MLVKAYRDRAAVTVAREQLKKLAVLIYKELSENERKPSKDTDNWTIWYKQMY